MGRDNAPPDACACRYDGEGRTISTDCGECGSIIGEESHGAGGENRIDTIRLVQTQQFWENESLDALENVRTELRNLINLLDEQRKTRKFVIDIEDEYQTADGGEDLIVQTTYKQRIIDYLAANSDNATLRKIQNFEQLTSADIQELERIFFEELGTRSDYEKLSDGRPYKIMWQPSYVWLAASTASVPCRYISTL